MKRGYILIVFLILLFPVINAGITGQATEQETGISVTVVSFPFVEILSPENITYTEGDYILLDYNTNEIETVWYNLDNTANITINSSFFFQTSVGSHTLYLYGNQSNGTILSDNVTFAVQAAPSTPTGGGGGRPSVTIEEEIIKETIPLTLKYGETKETKVLIKNDLNKQARIKIEDLNLEDLLIKISDTDFYLNSGETKEVTFIFYGDKNKIPELYIEKVKITTEDYEKEVSFFIELESLGFLFDVKVEIPEKPEIFAPGEELTAIVNFYNLGEEGEAEVEAEYIIKDEQGEIIFGEKQILIIKPSVNISKNLKLPISLEEGDYIFYVKVTYDSKTAIASRLFKVEKQKIIKTIISNLEKNKREIAIAISVLIGLYIILTPLEQLCGGKGISRLFKKKRRNGLRKYKKKVKRRINRKK